MRFCMGPERFYCEQIDQPALVELAPEECHHLLSVRRVKPGHSVELFDGRGGLGTGALHQVRGGTAVVKIDQFDRFEPPKARIVLAVSVPKAKRFDDIVLKCTEIGINHIIPVLFERTVKQPGNPEKAVLRWRKLIIEAAKQSRRLFLPQLDEPCQLPDALSALKNKYPRARLLAGSPKAQQNLFEELKTELQDTIVFIGPEGGFSPNEENFLTAQNLRYVKLTNTILRVETAAIAFASVLAHHRDSKLL